MGKLIFYNDNGFPYAVLAAAIKSGKLPDDRLPALEEMAGVLQLCGVGQGDATVYDMGRDRNSEKCLALWSRGNGDMVRRAVRSFLGIFETDDYKLIQVYCRRNFLLSAGVWLTRTPGLRMLGLSLIHRSVVANYKKLFEATLPH